MSKRIEEHDIQLELKDRLNYPEILQKGLTQLKNILQNEKPDMSRVQLLIYDLYTDIPDTWITSEDKDKLKDTVRVIKVDARPSFAGERLSVDYCKRNGIAVTKSITQVDYFKLKNWIVNLLDARQMLIRRQKIEMSTGINEIDTIESLEKKYAEQNDDE